MLLDTLVLTMSKVMHTLITLLKIREYSDLFNAALLGDTDVVKMMLVEYGIAVDIKNKIANCVATCGCNMGCGFMCVCVIEAPPSEWSICVHRCHK